jgi:protein required for attachment to host cells
MTSPGAKTAPLRTALTHGTWVLVADGAKALLLENTGVAGMPMLEVRREALMANPPTRAQGTDRPGRPSDGPGHHRSALEPTDWHQLVEDRFARDLADLLMARVRAGDMPRLILAVAPRALGELRKALPAQVADCVVAELAMDLTNHPVDEIAAHVARASVPD